MNDFELGTFRVVRTLSDRDGLRVLGALHQSELPVAVQVFTDPAQRAPGVAALRWSRLRAAARLAHPAITAVLDYGEVPEEAASRSGGLIEAGAPYVVTEHVPGGPLAQWRRPWSWPSIRRLLTTVLSALAYAHARGVIHGDVRPGRLLLVGPRDLYAGVKLADFGLTDGARDPHYRAPELDNDGFAGVGPWTDLYAVGVLGWRIATGRTPFAHASGARSLGEDTTDRDPSTGAARSLARAHRTERPPTFVARLPVRDGFEDWLRALLHKDPLARFVTAADALVALHALGGSDDETSGEPVDEPSREIGRDAPSRPGGLGEAAETAISLPPQVGKPAREEFAPATVAPFPEDWRSRRAVRPAGRLRGAGLGLYTTREIPLFGRDKQRDLLWKGLRGVHEEGRPRVVLVRGPSGIGKTRLVEWVAERAHEVAGVQVLWIRGDEIAAGVAAHLGLRPEELTDRAAVAAKLKRHRAAQRLADALAAGLCSTEDSTADFEAWRGAVRRLIELSSVDRPALFVVDRADEADEALQLARELAVGSGARRSAVLVVMIAREDDELGPEVENRIAAVLSAARAKIVHLEPLERTARADLLGWFGLTTGGGTGTEGGAAPLDIPRQGQAPGPAALGLGDLVEGRSKGNPQFAIQLVEDAIHRGLLVGGPNGTVVERAEEEASLPDDPSAVWATRIQQILKSLPAVAAIHLERAAALGMEVVADEWNVACDDPARGRVSEAGQRLRAQLFDRLRQARLVTETPQGFAFAHPLVREGIEATSRAAGRWAGHHQAIATLLQSADRPDSLRVGLHWLEAAEPDRAVEPLLTALDRSILRLGIAQVGQALNPLERALRESHVAEDDLRWARVWTSQAMVARRRGALPAAEELARRAREQADRPGAEGLWSGASRELARIVHERGDVKGALALLQQTAARLLRARLRGEELALVLVRMAVLARMLNQLDDAERWATQASGIIARAEIEDAPALEASVAGEQGAIACRRGRFARGLELFDEALPRLRESGEPARLAEVVTNRGEALKRLDRWEEAEAAFVEAAQVLESIGASSEGPQLNLALCRLHAGQIAEARQLAEEVSKASAKINALLATLVRSVCDLAEGAPALALRDLEPALEELRLSKVVHPDAAWVSELGALIASRFLGSTGSDPEERSERMAAMGSDPADVFHLFVLFAREQYLALDDAEGSGRVDRLLS